MNTIIVSKTRMQNSYICVGGIILDKLQSIRLLNTDGGNQPCNTPFNIGDIWDISGQFPAPNQIKAPHTEDYYVHRMKYVTKHPDIISFLRDNVKMVSGRPNALFGGLLRNTNNGNGYISQWNIPSYSTEFWMPDKDLIYDNKYYGYNQQLGIKNIKYVGCVPPIPIILANTIVRVSLARWWKPDDSDASFEPRCYLQISGWYGHPSAKTHTNTTKEI